MTIRVIGTSHHLAPPSRLQDVVTRREELIANLVRLQGIGAIQGAVLLATCNRLEIVLDGADTEVRQAILAEHPELPVHDRDDLDAVHYLLRVATGLESLVRGEDQILGQLREAFKLAEGHGLLSSRLRVLRTQLVAAARDVRQRTGMTKTKVSVASLGARELERAGRNLVVIGAGETGRLAVETLVKRGNCRVLLVNRTASRAEALARHFGIESTSLRDFLASREARSVTAGTDDSDPEWDGILIAVDSKTPILDARHVRGIRKVIDVSMPGVVDASAHTVPGVEILDLDSIARLVQSEGERRCATLDVATDLVAGRSRSLHRAVEEAGTGSHLGKIIDQHVETALQELQRVLDTKLRHLSQIDQDQVRQAVLRATKRNAHMHLQDVRELSGT